MMISCTEHSLLEARYNPAKGKYSGVDKVQPLNISKDPGTHSPGLCSSGAGSTCTSGSQGHFSASAVALILKTSLN